MIKQEKLKNFIRRMNKFIQKVPASNIADRTHYIRGIITSIISSSEAEGIFGDFFPYCTVYNLKKTRVYIELNQDWRGWYISTLYFGDHRTVDIERNSLLTSIASLNDTLKKLDYSSLACDEVDFSSLEKFKF